MIPAIEKQDRVEEFFQILLTGILFNPSRVDEQKKSFQEILRNWGIILNSSDFLILDHSKIGNFTITIARYTLDYVYSGDATEKRICIEGSVAIETDGLGNRHISISSKTDPLRLNFDISQSETSLICDKM